MRTGCDKPRLARPPFLCEEHDHRNNIENADGDDMYPGLGDSE